MRIRVSFFCWVALAAIAGCAPQSEPLRLATTTSVENSGLLQEILPAFQEATGIEVQVLPVGSGRALQLLRRGDADVALTHDPAAETAFLNERPSSVYRKVMYNDFVVVGPRQDDAAAVGAAATAADAMHRIALSEALFVSRGDESGTHTREQQLWRKAGAKPPAGRVLETGQGMAATLRVASERRAYTLTDRATFTQMAHTLGLEVLFQHDPDLVNTYAVLASDEGAAHPDVTRLLTWLTDGDGRRRIASFTIAGTRPFLIWPEGKPRNRPEDLP